MALNYSPEFYWYLIGAIFCLIATIIIIWNIFSKKNKTHFYYFFSILSISIFYFLTSFSFLFLSLDVYRASCFAATISTIFLFLFIDFTSRESVSPINIALISLLSGMVFILVWQENSIIFYDGFGYPSIKTSGIMAVVGNLVLLLNALFYFYWALRISIKAPKKLRKSSLTFLCGTLLLLGGYAFWTIQYLLMAPIGIIITGTGMLVSIISWVKEPKILYILPFKAYRLIVLHGKSGVPLFNYNWVEHTVDEAIYSGLLHALNNAIQILKRGSIKYILLTEGVLILKKSENVLVGLITDKTSKFLTNCINNFTDSFEKKYNSVLSDWNHQTDQFTSAKELIERFFANVPSSL